MSWDTPASGKLRRDLLQAARVMSFWVVTVMMALVKTSPQQLLWEGPYGNAIICASVLLLFFFYGAVFSRPQ